jgi:hypothetical protein
LRIGVQYGDDVSTNAYGERYRMASASIAREGR